MPLEIPPLVVSLVVVPLIGFMVLMKWKSTAARKAKIRELLSLVSEEACKAEAAAAAEYTNSTSTVLDRLNQCAVCFSPTASRCSKCKAVRYCSGKCQIVHWRQGHKQECQPADTSMLDSQIWLTTKENRSFDLHIQEMRNFSSVCQRLGPLSTEVDETSADSMPPHTNMLDSPILLKTKEKRSFDLHIQERRNISPVCQRLGPLGNGIDETSAAEGTNVLIINPKGTKEVSDIEVSNAIECAELDAFTIEPEEHTSSFDISSTIATHVPPKTAPINGMSKHECALSDASSICTEVLTNYVNSGSGSPSDGSSHSSENAVNHDPSFATEVNVIPFSTMTTVNDLKSLVCDLPASNRFPNNLRWSQDFEDEFNGHASFSHDHSSPGSCITDLTPDSPSKNGNVKNIIGDCPFDHSSSTNNHINDTADSINSMPDIHSEISLLDVWSSKNSDNNVVGSTSSISESSSLISDTSSSSLFNIKCQNQESNESNFTSSADETQGNGARKRYYEAVLCSSSQRERDFGCTFPGQDVCSIDEDTVAGHHPLHTTNSFERSEKKSGQQLRTPKVSTTNTAEPMDESLVKPKKKFAHKPRTPEVPTTNTAEPMDESLAKPTKLLFPYEHFMKLFNWDCLELPPRGLINCGNSCFANVVLQCLTYTRPLAAYLLQGSHSGKCQRKDWCFMCELEHLVSRVKEGESALSPIRILSRIKSIGNHLGYGRQEDAHEFLRFAVDTMQSICLDEAGGEKSLHPIAHLTTFIQQIFGGYLQSKVKCKKCHYESNRYEIMMDLTVEVNGNIMSLEDALKQFAAVELLDGDNKYKCDRCHSYVKAQKWLTVHEAPNILTIALKRFQTGSFGKLNKIVAFPEILDMSPYMSGTGDKPPPYGLYAVVVHLDVLNASYFGHYICYVKDLKGAWYKIDDSKVNPVAIDAVMSEGAYMLFYSRSSPRPPVVLQNEKVTNLKDVPVNQCTYDTKQSSLLGEHDEEADVHINQFPSPGSCRDANIDKNQPAIIKDLEKCSMDADSRIPDGFIPYSVRYGGLSPATQDRNDDFIPREYGDLTSSDSGSLFSGSDETSCSTDSNRDSISTVDLAETIFRDHSRYIAYGNFYMGEGCGISNSGMESSQCPSKTDKILENKLPNHPLEKDRINENDVTWSNQSFPNQGIRHERSNSSLSPCQPSVHSYVSEPSEHRDILDCGESAINRQRHIPHSHHFSVSESADCSKDNPCKDFAISAKWKHITGKCKAKEIKKLRLQTQRQTCTAATKFQHCVANDPGTSAFSSLHFLGFER